MKHEELAHQLQRLSFDELCEMLSGWGADLCWWLDDEYDAQLGFAVVTCLTWLRDRCRTSHGFYTRVADFVCSDSMLEAYVRRELGAPAWEDDNA